MQAKVLQIPVYYSHIIPSLALQACKTKDTLIVGFYIRSSLWTKERGPFGKLRDRGFGTVSEFAELTVKLKGPGNPCGMIAFALKG